MKKRDSNGDEPIEIRPYAQEALLIDAVPAMSGARVLCMSAGLAQIARAAAMALPHAAVHCTYLDLYRANLAVSHWHDRLPNLQIHCAADLPNIEADIVAFPFSAHGEAELTRDLIQSGHQRLKPGGRMYVATDNPRDTWLGEQLRQIFRKLQRRPQPTGVLYVGTKTAPLKKRKNFWCEFAFRDRGRLIRAVSRPGVFSHRHLDPGARRLIDEMSIEPGMRVLDVGCGAGVVALAAASRVEGVHVHAVDSNARAIECAQGGAELNGLTNMTTQLAADGNYAGAGSFDLALANPPYYAGFRIARHFLTAARAALRPGGTIVLITKQPRWYEQNMPEWFQDVAVAERKGYFIASGVRGPR